MTMLAATAGAVLAIAGCSSSHATAHQQILGSASSAHPLVLAPVASASPNVSSSGDRAACLTWRKSASALENETVSAAALSVTADKAISEASDPAFKRDAAATVNNYEAAQKASNQQTNDVMQMAQDLRDADNDCAADGVDIYGS